MKKLINTFLLLAGINFYLQAQFVSIPDTNFGTFLNARFPACMQGNNTIGWQMDTTCPALVTATFLDCTSRSISDLTGIQYFDNLNSLYCTNNLLTSLPPLPNILTILYCNLNQLSSLPALPNSLVTLHCYNNQLIRLPALPGSLTTVLCEDNLLISLPALPNSLTRLTCRGNQLISLPALPNSLTELRCDDNQLSNLPILPNSLTFLSCGSNQLSSLPFLPNSLTTLNCENNQLSSLPALADSLTQLECWNNQLTALPVLPNGLIWLSCYTNLLSNLPTLPDSLTTLRCNSNQLTSLPALPSGLTLLTCERNQLSSLPALPNSLQSLGCQNNLLSSLPVLPSSLYSFSCGYNQLSSLPALPGTLIDLGCQYNQLNSLPSLPNSLKNLDCQNNQLTSLPELPDSLTICWIQNNPITCIPRLKRIVYLDFSNTLVNCVYNYGNVTNSTPSLQSFPLCQPGNPNGCAVGLTADAGNDTTICPSSSVTLGGNPTASQGTAPYTYMWSPAIGISCTNCPNPVANPTVNATYSVTITDNTGATATDLITVSMKPGLQLAVVSTANPSTCNGNNGQIIISGLCDFCAPSSLTYEWNSVPQGPFSISGWPQATITGLSTGTYTNLAVSTNGGNGCPVQGPIVLSHPSSPVVDSIPGRNTCFGESYGSACVYVSGGTPSYTYTWSNSQNIQCANTLSVGTHSVTVSDASACSVSSTVTINEFPEFRVDSTIVTDVTCNGGSDGSICVYLSGGAQPYFYAWSINATTQCITNLQTGNYNATVGDANGCTASANGIVTESSALNLQLTSATGGVLPDTICTIVTGGVGGYTYNWTGNGIDLGSGCYELLSGVFAITVTDTNNCSATNASNCIGFQIDSIIASDNSCSGTASACVYASGGTQQYTYSWSNGATAQCVVGLGAGNYTPTATVSDANNCSVTASVSISQPGAFQLNYMFRTNVSCFGGSDGNAAIYTTGGRQPRTYLWSNGATTQVISNVPAGTYSATVTDANNCTVSSSITVMQPPPFTVQTTSATSGIFPDTICVSVTGGVAPFSYNWNGNLNVLPNNCFELLSGSFAITVTDANGCNALNSGGCSLQINSFTTTNVSCNGGSDGAICANVSGGTPGYSFLWSHTETTQCTNTGLTASSYTVTVSDAGSCTVSGFVTITEPAPLSISETHTNVSCNGTATGSIDITVSGGTPGYAFLWSHSETVQDPINLAAGIYTVSVFDANACSATKTITISEPSQIITSITIEGDGIFPDTLDIAVSGGCPPYLYQWNTGSNTTESVVIVYGTYTLTITDNCICSAVDSIVIGGLTASVSTTDVLCNGMANGIAIINTQGGDPPFQFSIDGGVSYQNSDTFQNLPPGNYSVIVIDNSGSTDTVSFTITEPAPLEVVFNSNNISCFGANDGSINTIVTGGTVSYTLQWSDTVFSQDRLGLSAGTYSITVWDNNACTASDTVTITEPAQLTAQFVYTTDGVIPDTVFCYVAGGTPFMSTGTSTYVVSWGDGDISIWDTSAHIYNTEGIYNPVVTDSNGCQVNDTLTLGCLASCVWPGDADNNGIADNYDLLPIGLAYGTTDIARTQQDINWYGHPAQDWTDTLANGTNYKHVDCDGNATINANDTLAILQNFLLTHAKRSGQKEWRMADPALYVDLVPDTTRVGDTMYANLSLGDINIPASNVYGLAFTVNYDALVVDSSKTQVTFGNSWLGTATDKISIAKDLSVNGQLKCAITRIDRFTRSGFGQIGHASFVITTDNINGKDQLAYYSMQVWISDLVVIDSLGNLLSVNEGSDSSQVEFEPVGVQEFGIGNYELGMYPNPASGEVQLVVSENLIGGEIKLLDVTGRVLFQTPVTTRNAQLETHNLDNGIYLVQVITEKGIITKRLVVTNFHY